MSILQTAKKPTPRAPILTIVGSAGAGKSSLAGMFQGAVFIQAESAETVFESWPEDKQPALLDPLQRPSKQSRIYDTVIDTLRELITTEHGFKTLVIDSITALATKIENEVALHEGVETIADAAGGYHKGYILTASKHAEIVSLLEVHRTRKKMAVVLLAHSAARKMKNSPDDASEYSVHDLAMHEKSAAQYINNSDAVLYIKNQSTVMGAETDRKGRVTKLGRRFQTGERVIITSGDGLVGYVSAKTRYDMPAEIPYPHGENPLMQYIPFFNTNATEQQQ